jgi:hypothetical protein
MDDTRGHSIGTVGMVQRLGPRVVSKLECALPRATTSDASALPQPTHPGTSSAGVSSFEWLSPPTAVGRTAGSSPDAPGAAARDGRSPRPSGRVAVEAWARQRVVGLIH